MEPKKVAIYAVLAAVVAILLDVTDLADKAFDLSEKRSVQVKSTTICSEGDSIHIKTDSRAGMLIAKKLEESLDHRCQVFPPTAPTAKSKKGSVNEVAYFHDEDADKAVDLAQKLLACCQIVAEPNFLRNMGKRDSKRYYEGYFEVWLR